MSRPVTLTLYSKPGCHLCEELRSRLDDLQAHTGFALEEIDITSDPELFARYRYDIPVLLQDGKEIGRGRIPDEVLAESLRRV
jgi:glutaredoxin